MTDELKDIVEKREVNELRAELAASLEREKVLRDTLIVMNRAGFTDDAKELKSQMKMVRKVAGDALNATRTANEGELK